MENTFVQDTEMDINNVTDKSLESTRQMLQMVVTSQEKGKTTMIMLDEQGKQLMNIEKNLDETKENVKIAQKNLNKLSPWWSRWLNHNRKKSIKNNQRCKQVKSTETRDGGVISSQATTVHNTCGVSVQPGPYIKRITNDAREKEMEGNLEQVVSFIGDLKIMAIDICNEFDKQNETIDRITDKVEITTSHVEAATKKANKLIKK